MSDRTAIGQVGRLGLVLAMLAGPAAFAQDTDNDSGESRSSAQASKMEPKPGVGSEPRGNAEAEEQAGVQGTDGTRRQGEAGAEGEAGFGAGPQGMPQESVDDNGESAEEPIDQKGE